MFDLPIERLSLRFAQFFEPLLAAVSAFHSILFCQSHKSPFASWISIRIKRVSKTGERLLLFDPLN